MENQPVRKSRPVQGKPQKPSEAELRILHVLWKHGPSTVRGVYEKLENSTGVGYTTILKLLQIMFEKGFVQRDESARRHVYAPLLAQEQAEEMFLGDLLENVFNGSKKRLVLQILSEARSSGKELQEIRELVLKFEKER